MKQLGIIGGMSPMATAYFMQLVIEMTEAAREQEHIPMFLYNCPQIPDRTRYLLGESQENPAEQLLSCGKKLEQIGAELLAIPCISAHAFWEELQSQLKVPMLHIIKETADYLKAEGVQCVGMEATDGTLRAGVFQRELERQGIRVILPTAEKQEMVMHLIYHNIKSGLRGDMERFGQVEQELREHGAEVILLGCTDLSVINRDEKIGHGYLDALEVLARAATLECGTLKKKYKRLLT